jgi:hypothetical protein
MISPSNALLRSPNFSNVPQTLGLSTAWNLAIGKIESKGPSLFRFLKVIDLKKRFSKTQVMDGWMDG